MSTKVIIDSTAYVGIDTIEVGGKVLTLESAGGSGTGQEGQAIYLEDLPTEDIVDNTLYYIGRDYADEIGEFDAYKTYTLPDTVYKTPNYTDFAKYYQDTYLGLKQLIGPSFAISRSSIKNGFRVQIKNVPQFEGLYFTYYFEEVENAGNEYASPQDNNTIAFPVFLHMATAVDALGLIFYAYNEAYKDIISSWFSIPPENIVFNKWNYITESSDGTFEYGVLDEIEFTVNQTYSYSTNNAVREYVLKRFTKFGIPYQHRYIHFDNQWAYLGEKEQTYQEYLDDVVTNMLEEASNGVY